MRLNRPAAWIILACCLQAEAGEALAPITVSASREDRALQDLAGNATVITQAQTAERQEQTLADTLSLMPGVSMGGSGRFGAGDVQIRGISGNRVKMTVDGLPIADQFSFGPFQNSGRNFFDVSDAQQVEIIRGPVSSLHGASALGGVVSIINRSPQDFLKKDADFGGEAVLGYTGKNQGRHAGIEAAFHLGADFSGLVAYQSTFSKQTKNHGGKAGLGFARGIPDPQDNHRHNFRTQLSYIPNDAHRFTLNASYFKDRHDSELLSTLGISPTPVKGKFYHTFSNRAEDRQSRKAASLTHDFTLTSPVSDSGYWRIYTQEQATAQLTKRFRQSPFIPQHTGLSDKQHESKDARFKTRDTGLDIQLDKSTDGTVGQEWLYGLSYVHRDVSMLRHNTTVNANGRMTENLIEKNAPNTTVSELGIFAQTRLRFAESGWAVIPGLRYDYYDLSPHEDNIYRRTVGDKFSVQSYRESRLSPRLGVLYNINDKHTLYANYSEGFRAPSFSETNLGFANQRQGYALVENPGLKPETSRGIELGWRMNTPLWGHTLTGFYTRYKDFIQTQAIKGFNRQTQLTEFHSINLPEAEIYGLEWSANLNLGQILSWQDGLSLQTSLAYTRGKNRLNGEAISSIEPLTGVAALHYDAPDKRWGSAMSFSAVSGKKNKDIAVSDRKNPRSRLLPTAGYGVLDITGYYRPTEHLTFRAGLYNALNKKYLKWSTAQYPTTDRNIYTEPGRWLGASVRYEF